MSEKESAQSVIEAHRKRQQMGQKTPMIVMIGAAMLLIIGAGVVIFWLLGDKRPLFGPPPTDTATATASATATRTSPPPTNTQTATLTPTVTETATPTQTPTPSGPFEYTVQEGDTLSSIAELFNTDIMTLLALNPTIDPVTLVVYVGQKILIPAPDTLLPTATAVSTNVPPGTLINYTVMPGDTLGDIAIRFNSTIERIVEENDLENANDIYVGQILRVPVNIATPVPTATVGTIYPTAPVQPTATVTP